MLAIKAPGSACILFCMAFLNCGGEQTKTAASAAANSRSDAENMYQLDIKNKSVSQPMDRDVSSPQSYKFVEVEVVKVVNPRMHPIAFEVHYETEARVKTFLGTFSLFPSDNPGKFIVPTQGKLKNEGNIILSLDVPKEASEDPQLKITVKKMQLRRD
jgi:hypothetical protein